MQVDVVIQKQLLKLLQGTYRVKVEIFDTTVHHIQEESTATGDFTKELTGGPIFPVGLQACPSVEKISLIAPVA